MEELISLTEKKGERFDIKVEPSRNTESGKIESVSEKKYISEVIGSEYKEWTRSDIILITAPTGSGKSHFILYVYLKWIIEQSIQSGNALKILYLVNRKVLKKQLEEELNRDVEDELFDCLKNSGKILSDYITISTYQNIEKGLCGDTPWYTIQFLQQFYSVIYDEAHYFYSDSDFNTYTQLSFDCLRKEFDCKLQIFMSATMKNFEEYLRSDTPVYLPFDNTIRGPILGMNSGHGKWYRDESDRYITYSVKKDYSYINVNIVDGIRDLADAIQNSNSKWLVFVDSIPLGKEFKDSLIANNDVKKEDVIFIDAKYQKDYEASREIEELTIKQSINRRIVIATAVLDNGVSFHDIGLRNMAIMADTEEEFVQMLGRKRDDRLKLNLYICKRKIDYFSKRYEFVKRKLDFYYQYQNDIDNIYCCKDVSGAPIKIKPYTDLYHKLFSKLEKSTEIAPNKKDEPCIISPIWSGYQTIDSTKYVLSYWNYAQVISEGERLKMQRKILKDIVCQDSNAQYRNGMCYIVNGLIAFNNFSIKKYRNLKLFYGKMKKALEEDDDAFIKQQFQWLNLSPDNETCAIHDYVDKLRKKIKDVVEPVLNIKLCTEYKNMFTGMTEKGLEKTIEEKLKKELGKERAKEHAKQKAKELIEELDTQQWYKSKKILSRDLVEYFIDKKKEHLKKKDRGLSEEEFNACMEQAELPYRMKRLKKSIFIIIDTSIPQDEPAEEPEN